MDSWTKRQVQESLVPRNTYRLVESGQKCVVVCVSFTCQTLEYLSSQHKYDFTGANNLENVHKNRFPNKLPSIFFCVKYTDYPGDVYINVLICL